MFESRSFRNFPCLPVIAALAVVVTTIPPSLLSQTPLAVALTAQTITFPVITSHAVGTPVALEATASSGLAVSFASLTAAVCTVSGTTATLLEAGTCTITATQAGNATYAAAAAVTRSFTVNHKAQTITFPAITSHTVGTALALKATASSGLAVSFASLTAAVCTVSGTTATLLEAGTCEIEATQAGNAEYAAAAAVTRSFTVNHEAQIITFPVMTSHQVGTPVALKATASSGLAVSFASLTAAVCTVSGTTATLLEAGTCEIEATQAGNAKYAAAAAVTQSFTVTAKAGAVITSFTATPATITSGASSSLTAVFSGGTGVITPGNISVTSGMAVSVSPTATTTYTLTVTPATGTAVTKTVAVTVNPVNTAGCPTVTSSATVGAWEDITPAVFSTPSDMQTASVAVDPSNPTNVYASAANNTNGGGNSPISTGVYESTDCGATWKQVSTGQNSADINSGLLWEMKFDSNGNNLYVANGYGFPPALYKSSNHGVDWTDLFAGKSFTLTGDTKVTAPVPLAQAFTYSGFVQAFSIDPTDPTQKHIVVTFHENCLDGVPASQGGWGVVGTDPGIGCLGETTDGGVTWRLFPDYQPSQGWVEASTISAIGPGTYLHVSVNGVYYTADGGQTWQQASYTSNGGSTWTVIGSAYSFYGENGNLAPDGAVYIGTSFDGVLYSKATSSKALGSPQNWTQLANSPQADTVFSDGSSLYTSYFTMSGEPTWTAPLSDPTSWTNMTTPPPSTSGPFDYNGANEFSYDPVDHILYAASYSGGLIRLITQAPTTSAPRITSFTATPASITVGASSSLAAVFSGTGVITPGNITATSGKAVSVSPTATTTYTLTVTPATGTAVTKTVTVTVTPAATAPAITSFTASPATITSGEGSSLTAVFTGGAGVITPGDITATSGTAVSVSPTATTTYTLTVTPKTGTAITETVTVAVQSTTANGCSSLPPVGQWQQITPAGYGVTETDALVVDPFDNTDSTIWLGTSGTGLFKSTDCGSTWTQFNTGFTGEMMSMAVDYNTPGNIYSTSFQGSQGLFQTTNGGSNWTQLFPSTSLFAQAVTYDWANSIGLDPQNPLHMIVSAHAWCNAPYTVVCVAETFDGGSTWSIINVNPPGTNWTSWEPGAGAFILPPTNGKSTFLFGTYSDGLYLTEDDGATWTNVTPAGGTGATSGKALIRPFKKSADGYYYLASIQGVIKSPDGHSWTLIPNSGGSALGLVEGDGNLYVSNETALNYSTASESNDSEWTTLTPPPATYPSGSQFEFGGVYLSYDSVHHILYSSNWTGGAWRMVMQAPTASSAAISRFTSSLAQ